MQTRISLIWMGMVEIPIHITWEWLPLMIYLQASVHYMSLYSFILSYFRYTIERQITWVISYFLYTTQMLPPLKLCFVWNKLPTQITKFMGQTWGPPGSYRPQMGPMLAPWTLISGNVRVCHFSCSLIRFFNYITIRSLLWLTGFLPDT